MPQGFFQSVRQSLLHLFYPRLCEGCGRPLIAAEEVLCLSCVLQIPETNYHLHPDNEAALRFAGRIPYQQVTSYAYFVNDGLMQHLVHGLKYRGRQAIGTYLGSRLGQQLKTAGWAAGIDCIVPVPLYRKKQASRGYNQSELIAAGLSNTLNIPVARKLLVRTRDTETQTSKTRQQRVSNMQNAFSVHDPALCRHKHILLCDDVLTTGATLEACALALLEQPGVKISIATIGVAIS